MSQDTARVRHGNHIHCAALVPGGDRPTSDPWRHQHFLRGNVVPGHPTWVLPWALRVLQQSGHPVPAGALSVPFNLHLHAGVPLLPGHARGESQGIQGWYVLGKEVALEIFHYFTTLVKSLHFADSTCEVLTLLYKRGISFNFFSTSLYEVNSMKKNPYLISFKMIILSIPIA